MAELVLILQGSGISDTSILLFAIRCELLASVFLKGRLMLHEVLVFNRVRPICYYPLDKPRLQGTLLVKGRY